MLFTKQVGDISKDNIDRAFKIIEWHLNQAKTIFVTDKDKIATEENAILILDWLKDNNIQECSYRDISRKSPVKDYKQRDLAMELLKQSEQITITSKRKSRIVQTHFH